MDTTIELVKKRETTTKDQYNDSVLAEDRRTVFATVRSVGFSEFYQAMADGLKPEVKFVLSDFNEYAGEKEVIFKGIRYRVLKTYQPESTDEIEITCYGGVHERT